MKGLTSFSIVLMATQIDKAFMKVGILAGGVGSRLSEETQTKPKPMIEIGGRPILWHIMKHYADYGFNEFVVALGYKGHIIKKYFADYHELEGNLTIDTRTGYATRHESDEIEWKVDLIDTGLKTNTGGRIKRIGPHMGGETCLLTWGDGVSDVDLHKLIEFHKSHGKLVTMTVVRPPARFGHVEMTGDQVVEFSEKPQAAEGWINGAFFVVEPEAFDYIEGDDTSWERGPLEQLVKDGELMAYRHEGFWQCMDTLRDKVILEKLFQSGDAPWLQVDDPS